MNNIKNICILLFLLSLGCQANNNSTHSDIKIILSFLKEVNPNLLDKINHDIALCYKPEKWETNIDTLYIESYEDSTLCYIDNISSIEISQYQILVEFKNIGEDTIDLLGASNGQIFASWYFFDKFNEIKLSYFDHYHFDINYSPCKIRINPKQSYYYLTDGHPYPQTKNKSMEQYIYYKPIIDSVYRYWLKLPEMKITNSPLLLIQQYETKLTPDRYESIKNLFYSIYIDPKEIMHQDSLIKIWVNR